MPGQLSYTDEHSSYCNGCGHYFPERETSYCCGATYCDGNCLSDHECYDALCYECDEHIRYGNGEGNTECGNCGRDYCCNCGPCTVYADCDGNQGSSNGTSSVLPYSFKPAPIFQGSGRVFMGTELEVGGYARHILDAVDTIDEEIGHLYVKDDGSLSSGAEIVSHPATLDWWRAYGYQTMLMQLRRSNCAIPHDEYGLHIHVNRNAFGPSRHEMYESPPGTIPHRLIWLLFMRENEGKLIDLARRECERWAAFNWTKLARKAKRPYESEGRYVAINCSNSATYELRFFMSTLKYSEYLAAVEFVDASVEYTRALQSSDVLKGNALAWSQFMQWADVMGYAALVDYMDGK